MTTPKVPDDYLDPPPAAIRAMHEQQRRMRTDLVSLRRAAEKAEADAAEKRRVFDEAREDLFQLSTYINKVTPPDMRSALDDPSPSSRSGKHVFFGGGEAIPFATADSSFFMLEPDRERAFGTTRRVLIPAPPAPGPSASSEILRGADGKNMQFMASAGRLIDLRPLTEAGIPQGSFSGSVMRKVVTDALFHLLSRNKRLSINQITEALEHYGIVLEVANPSTRISQILSEDMQFATARGVGWWLKGEDPGATGSSSATN